MKFVYPACFYKEADGCISVDIPDFNMAKFGNNLPDAFVMAADAIKGRIELAFEENEELPIPTEVQNIKLQRKNGVVSHVFVGFPKKTRKRELYFAQNPKTE
jgi:predicted RNase H-like HicB family nuclease